MKLTKLELSTKNYNKMELENEINQIYKENGLENPIIKWFSSPYEMLIWCAAVYLSFGVIIFKNNDEQIQYIENILSKSIIVNSEVKSTAREPMNKNIIFQGGSDLNYWVLNFNATHCFVADKPIEINLDEEGLLHNENGTALKYKTSKQYPEGFEIYAIHGKNIKKEEFNKVKE